ncbi:MAG: hypothetical protein ACREFY_14300 [Acetobacteraceae bacterium]
MRWITSIAHEVWRLFVDDGSFALAILVWLLIVWLLLSRTAMPSAWRGPVLFAGLALFLVWSAARRAKR